MKERALRASFWTATGFLLRQAFRFGSNIILARLLFPDAFGLMAIVNSVLLGLRLLSDMGAGPSIVRSPRGRDAAFLDTAWTIEIIRGFVLCAFGVLMAGPIAAFYEAPELGAMISVAATALLMGGFRSTSLFLFQRDLSAKRLEAIEVVVQVVPTACVILWVVFVEATVWAMVGGGVLASILRLGISHAVDSRRPRLRFEPAAARELLQFGKWVFVSTMFTFFADQTDRLIVGRAEDLTFLGIYSIATMLSGLPVILMTRIGAFALFPSLASYADRKSQFRDAYRKARRPLLAVGGGIVAVLAASASPLIEVLYDERYQDAAWVLPWTAAAAWFRMLAVPASSALLADGNPRALSLANASKAAGLCTFGIVGSLWYGTLGIVAGFLAADFLRFVVISITAHRRGWVGTRDDAASTVALVAVVASARFVGASQSEGAAPWVALVWTAGLAGALWIAPALWLGRELLPWRQGRAR